MPERPIEIRPARDEDRIPLAILFAAVAGERDGIATLAKHYRRSNGELWDAIEMGALL